MTRNDDRSCCVPIPNNPGQYSLIYLTDLEMYICLMPCLFLKVLKPLDALGSSRVLDVAASFALGPRSTEDFGPPKLGVGA